MTIAILGAGAFGTALALALSRDGGHAILWSRDEKDAEAMRATRQTGRMLPGLEIPENLTITSELPSADIYLIATPAQFVRSLVEEHASKLQTSTLISCAKGIERGTGLGPIDVIASVIPNASVGCLTGPSFAVDIARGLPTALVLAMKTDAEDVQQALTRPALRVYRTDDVAGAQIGGAVKNVMAIASGIAIGAGLGDSARASVIARGFAELSRYARSKGADVETLHGLSGLGDLVLTCTSEKSRNFTAGLQLGRGQPLDTSATVEGLATAEALVVEAKANNIAMPLTEAVAAVSQGQLDITSAIETLLARPAGKE